MAADIKKVHNECLNIIKAIDCICEKHEIKYALEAGTLLGAIRHHGFIPWDDDADIAMTRDNWNRFREAAGNELQEPYYFQLPEKYEGGKKFYDFIPRVFNKETGIWVDILIFDNIPEGHAGNVMIRKQIAIYALSMGHRESIHYDKYSFPMKCAAFISSLAGKCMNLRNLYRLQEKTASRYLNSETEKRFCSVYPPEFISMRMKKEWLDDLIKVDFEDIKLPVPKEYDEVLTYYYGDYMTPPPAAEQQPTHENEDRPQYKE